jgi:hypothetical protein
MPGFIVLIYDLSIQLFKAVCSSHPYAQCKFRNNVKAWSHRKCLRRRRSRGGHWFVCLVAGVIDLGAICADG